MAIKQKIKNVASQVKSTLSTAGEVAKKVYSAGEFGKDKPTLTPVPPPPTIEQMARPANIPETPAPKTEAKPDTRIHTIINEDGSRDVTTQGKTYHLTENQYFQAFPQAQSASYQGKKVDVTPDVLQLRDMNEKNRIRKALDAGKSPTEAYEVSQVDAPTFDRLFAEVQAEEKQRLAPLTSQIGVVPEEFKGTEPSGLIGAFGEKKPLGWTPSPAEKTIGTGIRMIPFVSKKIKETAKLDVDLANQNYKASVDNMKALFNDVNSGKKDKWVAVQEWNEELANINMYQRILKRRGRENLDFYLKSGGLQGEIAIANFQENILPRMNRDFEIALLNPNPANILYQEPEQPAEAEETGILEAIGAY